LVDTRLRQVTWPEIDKHHDVIVAMTGAGVTGRRFGNGCMTSTA